MVAHPEEVTLVNTVETKTNVVFQHMADSFTERSSKYIIARYRISIRPRTSVG